MSYRAQRPRGEQVYLEVPASLSARKEGPNVPPRACVVSLPRVRCIGACHAPSLLQQNEKMNYCLCDDVVNKAIDNQT